MAYTPHIVQLLYSNPIWSRRLNTEHTHTKNVFPPLFPTYLCLCLSNAHHQNGSAISILYFVFFHIVVHCELSSKFQNHLELKTLIHSFTRILPAIFIFLFIVVVDVVIGFAKVSHLYYIHLPYNVKESRSILLLSSSFSFAWSS